MIMAETKAKNNDSSSWLDTLARNPLHVGIAIGILAALVQVLLISAGGPRKPTASVLPATPGM